MAAIAVFVLAGAVIPMWQYVDAVTVPSGTDAQQAEVVSVGSQRVTGGSSRFRGRTATVRLPDGTQDAVYLDRRINFPDPGDEITVYEEDGDLRTTSERSVLSGVPLVVALGFLLWMAASRLTARRRRDPTAT
ncbi:hypothetical protein GCM10023340_17510 [Nocardioides marinquilinus]|uniref:DUF3592 domain-containing protein n=1 Tax=Nocardioides marinquilinus TaxID=1210400 RepID=A0ABP9PH94_9ACTN